MDDLIETLECLRDILDQWEDRFGGVVRIELRPFVKGSGEDLLKEHERPVIPMEGVRFQLENAIDSVKCLEKLRDVFGGKR